MSWLDSEWHVNLFAQTLGFLTSKNNEVGLNEFLSGPIINF